MTEYNGFKISCDGDKNVVDEVFSHDQYNVHKLPVHESGLMIDVGAHIGTFSRKWYDFHKDAKIVCVEPDAAKFECLVANVGSFTSPVNAMCTYLPWSGPVPSVTLEDILKLAGERYISCLKLEYEYDIIGNAYQTTLDRCQIIIGEWHGWDDRRFVDLIKKRIPDYFVTYDPVGIGNFTIINPYWSWRRRCGA
jgi:hypothetical protein